MARSRRIQGTVQFQAIIVKRRESGELEFLHWPLIFSSSLTHNFLESERMALGSRSTLAQAYRRGAERTPREKKIPSETTRKSLRDFTHYLLDGFQFI
ncbi:MAG: hypothetical protein ABSG56_11085 [Bryobacteraceae bacterium]